jgi:hypothetical protein
VVAERRHAAEQLAASAVAELELLGPDDGVRDRPLLLAAGDRRRRIGTFDWLVDGPPDWDDRLVELFGYEREDFPGTIEAFNAGSTRTTCRASRRRSSAP